MSRTEKGEGASDGGAGDSSAAPKERRLTRVVLVTGLSGAGKSTALKQFEDMGYEAVDNLPFSLVRRLLPPLEGYDPEAPRAIAVGIDSRTRDFRAETLVSRVNQLAGRDGVELRLVFFDSDDDVLGRRFTETRRRHPLAVDRPVMDGIARERELLSVLRDRADMMIDTSNMALPDLRRLLSENFALERRPGLYVSIMSFSYRYGLPREADLVFDVRFLANPYYVEELRHLTGLDPAVGAYISADENFAPFIEKLGGLLLSLLPHYAREGKSYLTIAVGCTGGRHRSVFVTEELAARLTDAGHRVTVRHRETRPASGGGTG